MRYIRIIILLVLCLTLLLLTGCIVNTVTPETTSGNPEYPGDTTKPVITGSPAPLPNSFGWNNTDVTVSFSCADTGSVQSGIDINTVSGETVTTEGKDQSVTNTGECIDAAGNVADPVTVSNINIDKTPPEVTITLPKNGKYVLNESVTATWSATDALSGVVSPVSGTVSIDTSSVGTKTFTLPAGTVMDKAGNSSLKVTISYSVIEDVEVDTTKPVITGSPAPLPNSFGWNNNDVTVSFSCADTGSVQSGIDINTVSGETVTTEGKDQSVTNTGECIDVAGNIADPATVSNINIDKTPPEVTITLPKNGKYVLNESVTATWSATDALSGVVEDSKDPKTIKIDTKSKGKKKITLPAGLVEDEAGNSSEEVFISYEVLEADITKPVITGSRAPLPNSLGWNNTDVTVSFSCEDVGPVQSGIETNTVAGATLTTEGKNQSVTNTGECIDAAGNVADPVTVSNINIDKTPPEVTITLPGTGEYVLNQSITATWSATDALSGVVSPVSGTVSIDTSSVGTKTFTLPAGTATDKAGNSSLKVTISYSVIEDVEVDTTKPVITGSPAPLPNSLGWNNTDVTVSFSCEDVGPVQSGIETNTVAGKTVTTEGKDQSVTNTGTCIDVAGNIADPATVSNINIDKTPPEVMITLPGTGEYVLNQSITATWSATDALSGVVSPVSGTVSIDTSSVGTKTFTLPAGTAMDKAGNNSLKVTKSYSVIESIEEPVKWSGLAMDFGFYPVEDCDAYFDTLLAAGFTEIRIHMSDPAYPEDVEATKVTALAALAKGFDVWWGVSAANHTLTAANWSDYATAVEGYAAWAQANGIYEFLIGNEEERHNDNTTLTDAQLRTNLRALATSVQSIFTNGDVGYGNSCEFLPDWITEGRGDIDQVSWMSYIDEENDDWKNNIDAMVAAFGTDHAYINEFNVDSGGYSWYSEDEAVQAAGITEMIDYFKASGITRAFFYEWGPGDFGVLKDDSTYRLLWSQALLDSAGSAKFATVPTKTTTASLLGTIALIPRITK